MASASTANASAVKADVKVVFPGDNIVLPPNARTRLSLGVLNQKNAVIATTTGVLKRGGMAAQQATSESEVKAGSGANVLWVDSATKRYHPQVDDFVIGTVVEKHAENYKVDIGLSQPAVLPALAFEGATKRNRPNIAVGALVYCRVAFANKWMEVELACTSPHFKKDWVTKESFFGELTGGYLVDCSLRLARTLMEDDCFVLSHLGKQLPFEVAIGANGKLWVNSATPLNTVLIANIILNSENLRNNVVAANADKLIHSIRAAAAAAALSK